MGLSRRVMLRRARVGDDGVDALGNWRTPNNSDQWPKLYSGAAIDGLLTVGSK